MPTTKPPTLNATSMAPSQDASVYRLPPNHYLHVLDQTNHVTRLEIGPQTFVRKDNECVVVAPSTMIVVPPGHYCVIENPVLRKETKEVVTDSFGQAKLLHADTEYRFEQDPFPLYPGERLATQVTQLQIVPKLTALKLSVLRDFEDEGDKRIAGDEYLFKGPGTYIPRKEVRVVATVKATIVRRNEALRLRAINASDAGREWLVREIGAYLPSTTEEIVSVEKAVAVTDVKAIHVACLHGFKDIFGVERKTGEEYLITADVTDAFIPDVHEQIVDFVNITTLNSRQYCVVLNNAEHNGDHNDQQMRLGQRRVVKGETSFFLKPGELLEEGVIKDVYVLSEDEGLVLTAREAFKDNNTHRNAGDRWMLKGPLDYIPPVEVSVESVRKAIPLHENEGVYVRNIRSGSVRAVIGQTYMLAEDEQLWPKPMPPMVRSLLSKNRDVLADRGQWINPAKEKRKAAAQEQESAMVEDDDPARVVTLEVPHNAAVQIYDYRSKQSRVVFGPDLVMLNPCEEFTQLSLSGGKPKRPNLIRAIALLLGPDFCSDIIHVETSDHARLQLTLSYNWRFDVSEAMRLEGKEASKLFCVPDFIGDMCNSIASRIRGAVSGVTFDDFHKNSARVIQAAAFGVKSSSSDPNMRAMVKEELRYEANHLVVTSIDVRSVEPVDQKTRDSLLKSVTLAIEITTQSQEAAAKREAERVDQEARGRLERQRIADEAEAEKARKELIGLKAVSAAVESTGQAKAEATSRAEAARIEAEAAVLAARLKADALAVESESELNRLSRARSAELEFLEAQNRLEIEKQEKMANIEGEKFKQMVNALGPATITALANAPQEHQVRLLQSLGLTSTLITDGRTPINLLNTASGLLGNIGESGKNGKEELNNSVSAQYDQ